MLVSRVDILREIEKKEQLLSQMVGTLYPSILRDEINKLIDKLREIDNAIIDSGR